MAVLIDTPYFRDITPLLPRCIERLNPQREAASRQIEFGVANTGLANDGSRHSRAGHGSNLKVGSYINYSLKPTFAAFLDGQGSAISRLWGIRCMTISARPCSPQTLRTPFRQPTKGCPRWRIELGSTPRDPREIFDDDPRTPKAEVG
jgi:hypothetical protein